MTNTSTGLETLFGPGAQWPGFNAIAFITLSVIITLGVVFLFLIRNYYRQRDKRKKTYQLFLYKTKQLGLTAYQYKVLSGLIDILALNNPGKILEEQSLFESSIGRFLTFLMKEQLTSETLKDICRDLVITYEKIYRPMVYRSPIVNPEEIETDTLLFFSTDEKDAFIAKVIDVGSDYIHTIVFRKGGIQNAMAGKELTAYIWRAGDAEYSFVSKIGPLSGNKISILMPKKLIRGKEERLPLVDVMLPCEIEKKSTGELTGELKEDTGEDERVLTGTISKLNKNEAIVRMNRRIDYNHDYYLKFVITDFNVHVLSRVIADRTLTEGNTIYHTFKFIEATEAAKKILKDYVINRLESI